MTTYEKIRELFGLIRGHYEWEAHQADEWRELAFKASGQTSRAKPRAETAEKYSLEWSNRLELLLEALRGSERPEEKPQEVSSLFEEGGAMSKPVCRICGCTDERPCPDGCWWVEPDLCSTCAERLDAEGEGEDLPEPLHSSFQVGDLAGLKRDDPTFGEWGQAVAQALRGSERGAVGIWSGPEEGSELLGIVYEGELFLP